MEGVLRSVLAKQLAAWEFEDDEEDAVEGAAEMDDGEGKVGAAAEGKGEEK